MFRRGPILKKRRKGSKRKFHFIFRVIVSIAIFLSIPLALFYILTSLVIVKKISCSSQFGQCSSLIEQRLDEAVNLKLRKALKSADNLLKSELLVKSYNIKYQVPDTLTIYIIERKPEFAIKKSEGEEVYLIDKDGRVLQTSDSTNLPKIIYEHPYNEGELVEERVLFSLELVYELAPYYRIESAGLSDNHLVLELERGPKVVFPSQGDRKLLLGSFNLIMSRLNSEDEDTRIEKSAEVKEIDLRFKNPVLKL